MIDTAWLKNNILYNRYKVRLTQLSLILFVVLNVYYHRFESGHDLASSYVACRMMVEGTEMHIYDHNPFDFVTVSGPVWPDTAHRANYGYLLHPYIQAPLWAYSLIPLCSDPHFRPFKLIFLIWGLASIAGMIWLTAHMWARSLLEKPILMSAFLICFTKWAAMRDFFELIQTHPIYLFAALFAIYLADRGKIVWSGFMLAFAAAVKISPAVLAVYWLINNQWKSALSFFLWTLAFALFSLAVLGLDINLLYLSNLQRISNVLLVGFANESFVAFFSDRTWSPVPVFHWTILPLPPLYKYASAGIMLSVLAAIAYIRYTRPERMPLIHPLAVCLIMVTSMMCANIAWNHYFILLAVPITLLTGIFMEARIKTRVYWLIPIALAVVIILNMEPISLTIARRNTWAVWHSIVIVRSQFWAGLITMVVLSVFIALFSFGPRPEKRFPLASRVKIS